MVTGITEQTFVVLLVCSGRCSGHGYLVVISFRAFGTVLGTHRSPQYEVNTTGSVGNGSGLRVAIILASTAEILWPITDDLIFPVLIG